jgi:hypothetical protein
MENTMKRPVLFMYLLHDGQFKRIILYPNVKHHPQNFIVLEYILVTVNNLFSPTSKNDATNRVK